MAERVSIHLGEEYRGARDTKRVPAGMRRVDIAKKFRRVILLALFLYALSSFQTTYIVDKLLSVFINR